jgi:hypothetical protein
VFCQVPCVVVSLFRYCTAALTWMVLLVPVLEGVAVSVAVTVRLPAVPSVALKVCTPSSPPLPVVNV